MNWEGEGLGANQDGARQALCDWIDGAGKTCAAFDFPMKGILQYAVAHCEYWRLASDGKPTGAGLGERRGLERRGDEERTHGSAVAAVSTAV